MILTYHFIIIQAPFAHLRSTAGDTAIRVCMLYIDYSRSLFFVARPP